MLARAETGRATKKLPNSLVPDIPDDVDEAAQLTDSGAAELFDFRTASNVQHGMTARDHEMKLRNREMARQIVI